jgi:FMN hydrolase / 5-amino-6-(5-phospho-D-ribitylamino)uracil phosphatase
LTEPAVVSFDLDETLWEFMPMMDGALLRTIARLEERVPGLSGSLTVDVLHAYRAALDGEAGTYEELRMESFRRALADRGVVEDGLPRWMVDVWMAERVFTVELHPDVEPEMDLLASAGHVLGAITNGNFPVEKLGVARRFAFVVHAERVGELKPAAAPFLHATELAGGQPERWVHVGDDLDTDIAGAQACGMKAVWINRSGRELPEGYAPDAELPSLDGLAELVARLV